MISGVERGDSALELSRIIAQYRARRETYAWEVFHALCHPADISYLALLRYLAVTPYRAITSNELAPLLGVPVSKLAREFFHLCEWECLVEMRRESRAPVYRLSDFGLRVAANIPTDVATTLPDLERLFLAMQQGVALRGHRRKSHYPWPLFDPEITQRLMSGESIAKIAQDLDIKPSTLHAHCKSKGMVPPRSMMTSIAV